MKNYLKKITNLTGALCIAGGILLGCMQDIRESKPEYRTRNEIHRKLLMHVKEGEYTESFTKDDVARLRKADMLMAFYKSKEGDITAMMTASSFFITLKDKKIGRIVMVDKKRFEGPNSYDLPLDGIDMVYINEKSVDDAELKKYDLDTKGLEKKFDEAASKLVENLENKTEQ